MSRTLDDASCEDSPARTICRAASPAAVDSCREAPSISSAMRPSSASVASTSAEKRSISPATRLPPFRYCASDARTFEIALPGSTVKHAIARDSAPFVPTSARESISMPSPRPLGSRRDLIERPVCCAQQARPARPRITESPAKGSSQRVFRCCLPAGCRCVRARGVNLGDLGRRRYTCRTSRVMPRA